MVGLCVWQTALAADWVFYGVGSDGSTTFYYDSSSVRKNEDETISVWTKIEFKKPKPINRHLVKLSLNRKIVDCAKMRIGDNSEIQYYTDGSNHSLGYQPPEDVVPETTGEALYKAICG